MGISILMHTCRLNVMLEGDSFFAVKAVQKYWDIIISMHEYD